jgi:hypothetical protein
MPNHPKPSRPKPSSRLQRRYDPLRKLAPQRGAPPPEMIELVDPRWILKALAAIFGLAFVCAYLTICILFARSQWQLVLYPSHTVAATPAALNLPFTEVHFGIDNSGLPQLEGWWVPASPATTHTALILHAASGSIANALPAAQLLHNQHLNVLLFDYRGYGHSLGQHPTQASMQSDAVTALTYLTLTRSIPTSSIVVYGTGVGASIAVRLCADDPTLPALILQSPDGDLTARVRQDPRAKLVPFTLLFNQPFPLAAPLSTLATPRLILNSPTPTNTASLTQFLTNHLPPNPSQSQ